MTSPADLFLPINNLRLHVRDWGGEGQPMVLVHGLASNAKIWDWVAPLLTANFRVAALDQRSHGLSDAPADSPPGSFGFEAVCADLHGVLEQLNFARPFIVGHSWGANVALEYAARYQDAARGLVLLDGGFLMMSQRMTWPEAERRLAPPRLAGTSLAQFREWVKEFSGDLFTDELLRIVLGNFEVLPDGTIRPHLEFDSHMRIVRAMWEESAEQIYPRVKCPSLFLPVLPPQPHGELEDEYLRFKREGTSLVERLMPQGRVEWLTDSIHDVPLQRPGLVAEKIKRFVLSI